MPHCTAPAPLHYQVVLHDVHAHLYRVTLTIAQPAKQQEASLPVWIPGSYLVREFAKNLHQLAAHQNGQPCAITQCDKHRWRVACTDDAPLVLTYLVSAYDNSVRMAWLDQRRGFFNGTSLLLRIHNQEQLPHDLEVIQHENHLNWQLITALPAIKIENNGFGCYRAPNYDALVDSPVEMGTFWRGSFSVGDTLHHFVVAGAPATFDGERLLADTQKICAEQIRLWHPDGSTPEQQNYVFMLHATHDGYGGLEHRHSTALICNRADLPRQGVTQQAEGYTTLLGLISHEYFHTWNVKRLRPAAFAPYDYDRENYTELLWFFEGITSYYDDLVLHRTGLIDTPAYFKLLAKTINQVLQTPGRKVQSVAQASFDAWVKYYRPDENTANATVSYYTKGALVGLCLDLQLRREGSHLDALMRHLWQHCPDRQVTQERIAAGLHALTGRDWQAQITAWVHGTEDLPLADLLAHFGVSLEGQPPAPAQALGLRVQEGSSIALRQVLRGSPAEQAGMMAGDEWYGIEVAGQGWRIGKLDELALYAPPGSAITALVARDKQLLRLALQLPQAADLPLSNVQLRTSDNTRLAQWLPATASV
ncbi:Uncharacterised protein [uncultured Comamonas sp.]|nr:Uncharacterised protein [uncultured Comamonas sp.]